MAYIPDFYETSWSNVLSDDDTSLSDVSSNDDDNMSDEKKVTSKQKLLREKVIHNSAAKIWDEAKTV